MNFIRNFTLALFILCFSKTNGQSFITYKDTVNRFTINIPAGWKYGANIKLRDPLLIAQKTPINQADTSRDNFNINVIRTPTKTLDKTFADFLSYLPDAKNYKLINTAYLL